VTPLATLVTTATGGGTAFKASKYRFWGPIMRAISLKPHEFSLKRNALGSSAQGTVYGLYIHKYLAVHVPIFGNLGTEEALEKFLEAESDADSRLHIAMQHVTASHELRHFHDCFGTFSGALLFLAHMAPL
jgi:hypothetical protein